MARTHLSWGRVHRFSQGLKRIRPHSEISVQSYAAESENGLILPYGMGRSYGDSNLNADGLLVDMTRRDHVLGFDRKTGLFRAQAGLTLDKLLQISVPHGWFLPVSPGTKFVTLGGAIANDVHGKNHHRDGSFGAHVTQFALNRSDGPPKTCAPNRNKKLFEMTIGGLGLTGIIDWIEIQLKPIKSAYLDVENLPYKSLDEFHELSESSSDWPYSVAWIDCFAPPKQQGRGIFTRARFTDHGALDVHGFQKTRTWPFTTPSFLLNRWSIKTFNALYRHRPGARYIGRMHYDAFFYPLDNILHWNRLYGRKGFYQHQSLIPLDQSREGIPELLGHIRSAGQGSFLAVLKMHGEETSPGQMSFCRVGKGVSLALDFANKGDKILRLLDRLDACILQYGGRTYPAKDGRMRAEFYQSSYPDWRRLESMRDPVISSSFWRRVSAEAGASD